MNHNLLIFFNIVILHCPNMVIYSNPMIVHCIWSFQSPSVNTKNVYFHPKILFLFRPPTAENFEIRTLSNNTNWCGLIVGRLRHKLGQNSAAKRNLFFLKVLTQQTSRKKVLRKWASGKNFRVVSDLGPNPIEMACVGVRKNAISPSFLGGF